MSQSQQPAGGGAGGVGPSSTASRGSQKLTHANACWVRANRKTLDEHLPAPGATWRWGDTSLSRSILCTMRNRGLIEQRKNGEWETTRRAWDALERYTTSEGDRGEIVGQQELEAYVEEAQGRDR